MMIEVIGALCVISAIISFPKILDCDNPFLPMFSLTLLFMVGVFMALGPTMIKEKEEEKQQLKELIIDSIKEYESNKIIVDRKNE